MNALARWIDDLPDPRVYVSDPVEPDYLFLYWYLQRFTQRWPFGSTTSRTGLHDAPRSLCPLTGCRSPAQTS
jgi:hypothetical protein